MTEAEEPSEVGATSENNESSTGITLLETDIVSGRGVTAGRCASTKDYTWL